MKFVNCNDWFLTKNAVLCIKQFDKKFILKRNQNKLNWNLHSVPTIHSEKNKKTVSFADYNRIKKISKNYERFNHQPNEFQDFLSVDTIKDFNHLEEEKFCPNVFGFKRSRRLYSKSQNSLWPWRTFSINKGTYLHWSKSSCSALVW